MRWSRTGIEHQIWAGCGPRVSLRTSFWNGTWHMGCEISAPEERLSIARRFSAR